MTPRAKSKGRISGRKKWALIAALLSSIILSAVFVSEPSKKPNVVEIPLGNVLPAKCTYDTAPTSYWADLHHIVCCFQGANTLISCTNIRRGMVYEYPSGRSWRLQALDSQNHKANSDIDDEWEYIGLSKDHKHLFANISGDWYTTSAVPIASGSKVLLPKWTHFAYADYVEGGIITFPCETANETGAKVPVIDRFKGFPGYDSKAISPSGAHVAWLDTHLPPEHLHQFREFLRGHHILSERPSYAIWVSDPNGRNAYCLASFGKPNMKAYDLRWSPDEKLISCFSISNAPGPAVHASGPNSFRLTVFNVKR